MDGIKLFGMTITTTTTYHKSTNITDDLEENRTNRKHSQEDQLTHSNQERELSLKVMTESDGNTKTAISEDADTTKDETEGDATNSQHQSLKKPDKLLPCLRCNSMDTKFCYYNNYNVKQPRHFCKSCQRYWTAGGSMRNMPVGAGRRKHKHPTSQIDVAAACNGLISVPSGFLSFGLDLQNVDSAVSCRDKENGDDCSSGSTVTTSNSVAEKTQERNGFHSQVPCIPAVSWSYNLWNSSIPIPYSKMPMPIYPSPYWNYIPWLPLSSPTQNQNSIILGKHSRDGELVKPKWF